MPPGFAQHVLELGECLFDWVEIWAVGRQEASTCASTSDRLDAGLIFVTGEIVEVNSVAVRQFRHKHLLDIGKEALAIDRGVKHRWRSNVGRCDPGNADLGFPVGVRNFRDALFTDTAPALEQGHVDLEAAIRFRQTP